MRLRITIAMCMVEIHNRKTIQSKVNICKSDVKIGDYADSLLDSQHKWIIMDKLTYGAVPYSSVPLFYNFHHHGLRGYGIKW